MRGLAVALAVSLWTLSGLGLELAHPGFFASEPVAVMAPVDAPEPQLRWHDAVHEAKWEGHEVNGRVRWTAELPHDAPLGPWQVCLPQGPCRSFLRVEDEKSLLVVAAAPGSTVTVGEEQAAVGERGEVFFVLAPGDHEIQVLPPAPVEPLVQGVSLGKGERTEVTPLRVQLRSSSDQVLPGYAFTIWAGVEGPVATHVDVLTLDAPAGWHTQREIDVLEPEAAWEVLVPEDFLGEATLTATVLPLGLEGTATVSVARRLTVEVVTAHWRVAEDRLDLTEPGEITYERLRWAASLRGEVMPHTGLTITQAHLEELARKWQED